MEDFIVNIITKTTIISKTSEEVDLQFTAKNISLLSLLMKYHRERLNIWIFFPEHFSNELNWSSRSLSNNLSTSSSVFVLEFPKWLTGYQK